LNTYRVEPVDEFNPARKRPLESGLLGALRAGRGPLALRGGLVGALVLSDLRGRDTGLDGTFDRLVETASMI
jgi:hypothetical protein